MLTYRLTNSIPPPPLPRYVKGGGRHPQLITYTDYFPSKIYESSTKQSDRIGLSILDRLQLYEKEIFFFMINCFVFLFTQPFTKPSINESNPIGESDRLLVDSFTFIHNDIQLSTNSVSLFYFYISKFSIFIQSQYRTIMDIVNNLLLYVEPKKEVRFT